MAGRLAPDKQVIDSRHRPRLHHVSTRLPQRFLLPQIVFRRAHSGAMAVNKVPNFCGENPPTTRTSIRGRVSDLSHVYES
jgi:hypothetical protein